MMSSLLMVVTGALALVAGANAQAVSGTDILNFALQLEYVRIYLIMRLALELYWVCIE